MAAARPSALFAARDDDHDEVRCALTVASTMWLRGERDEAIRWLRRAAKAAADVDEVIRALELSKALADIHRPSLPTPRLRAVPTVAAASEAPPPRERSLPKRSPTRPSSAPPPPPRRAERKRSPEDASQDGAAAPAEVKPLRAAGARPSSSPPRPFAAVPSGPPRPRSKPPSEAPRPRSRPPEPRDSGTRLRQPPLPRELAELPVDDLEEPTFVMGDADSDKRERASERAGAPPRVAVLPNADGAPRLLPLAPDQAVPEGAVVALLVAADEQDAASLARCFETPR